MNESPNLSYRLAYLPRRWQENSINLWPLVPCYVKNVLIYIVHITVVCVIIFAVVKQLTRAALQQFANLGTDVTTGFSVSVYCAGTSLKWKEWEVETTGNFVLWLYRNEVIETSGMLHFSWPQNKILHTPWTTD
jgi:hypothetical protein